MVRRAVFSCLEYDIIVPMNKKPLLNAFLAELYIVAIVFFMWYGVASHDGEDSVFAPIIMLSLFVLSAAVMGYLFLLYPLQLYFDGKRKEAVASFLQTVVAFAVLTLIILAVRTLLVL